MAINITAQTCDEAWRQAAMLVRNNGIEQESRTFRSKDVTTETLELLHSSITIEDPRQRIVLARPINPAFAIAEVIWILAGSKDLAFINYWNPLMKKFSDDGKSLHGAYGYRLGMNADSGFDYIDPDTNVYFVPSHFAFNQLYEAYNALQNVPHTRQVILQIWDGRSDFPLYGKPRYADIPCNIVSDLLVRDGKLHWRQTMRSNDLMWGTPYNFIQWTTIQEIVAGWLDLEPGIFTLDAASLHVYAEHWDELKALDLSGKNDPLSFVVTNDSDLRIKGYDNWLCAFKHVLKAAVEFVQIGNDDVHSSLVYKIVAECENNLSYMLGTDAGVAYTQWVYLLAAEVCRKLGAIKDAERFAEYSGPYYQKSWMQWLERKQAEARK